VLSLTVSKSLSRGKKCSTKKKGVLLLKEAGNRGGRDVRGIDQPQQGKERDSGGQKKKPPPAPLGSASPKHFRKGVPAPEKSCHSNYTSLPLEEAGGHESPVVEQAI